MFDPIRATNRLDNEEDEPLQNHQTTSSKNQKETKNTQPSGFAIIIAFITLMLLFLFAFTVFIFRTPQVADLKITQPHTFNSLLQTWSFGGAKHIHATDNIIKPKIDNRKYRGLELLNGMKVLLISDPESSIASAALSVHVGAFEDPKEMPGLAHYVEHSLFLKSKKYPETLNYLREFVGKHGGNANAFTQREFTTYNLQVTSGAFKQALERFSHFFIDPIFTPEVIKGEVTAIDEEFNRLLNHDAWRSSFVIQTVANPESLLERFFVGNTESLINEPEAQGLDVASMVEKFFEQYYSANIMSLVVSDKKSVEELEDLVSQIFSKIPNKHIEVPDHSKHTWPFSGEYSNKMIWYTGLSPSSSVKLLFTVEDSSKRPYVDPYRYFASLISNRAQGSLVDILMREGLAYDLNFGIMLRTAVYDLIAINIIVTEKGLSEIERILELTFAYLDLIKAEGITPELYGQFLRINRYSFDYLERGEPLVAQLSEAALNLQKYPMKYVLGGESLLSFYDKGTIRKYFEQFNSQNLMVFIAVPPTSMKRRMDKYSSLYGFNYSVSDIPNELLIRLSEISYREKDYLNMKIEGLNEFIPKQLKLVEKPCPTRKLKCKQDYDEDAKIRRPEKIIDDEYSRVWYQLERSSRAPIVLGVIKIYSEQVEKDLTAATVASVHVELVRLLLEEEFYEMELAGEMVDIQGNEIKIRAFSDVFGDLLKVVMEKFKNRSFTREQFEQAKERLSYRLHNSMTQNSFLNLMKYRSKILLEDFFMEHEILESLEDLTYGKMSDVLGGIYSNLFVESLFMGNLLEEEAKEFNDQVVKILDYQPIDEKRYQDNNNVLDIRGQNLVFRFKNLLDEGDESFILNTYQVGVEDVKSLGYLLILVKVVDNILYTYLRTEKQLCYIINSYNDRLKDVFHFNVLVESSILHPNEIDEQIEIGLLKGRDQLEKLSDAEFETLINSLKDSLSDEGETLREKVERYWIHIGIAGDYLFDLRLKVSENLGELTKEGLFRYFKDLFESKPNKLSIQIYPKSEQELPYAILSEDQQVSRTKASLIISDLDFLKNKFDTFTY